MLLKFVGPKFKADRSYSPRENLIEAQSLKEKLMFFGLNRSSLTGDMTTSISLVIFVAIFVVSFGLDESTQTQCPETNTKLRHIIKTSMAQVLDEREQNVTSACDQRIENLKNMVSEFNFNDSLTKFVDLL